MISEQEKQYCICDSCVKTSSCPHYKDIRNTLSSYSVTPLYVHFINCEEYKSSWGLICDEIDKLGIPECPKNITQEDVEKLKGAIGDNFNSFLERENLI